MQDFIAKVEKAATYLREHACTRLDSVVILGSGLGELFDTSTAAVVIDYADIPGMPMASTPSHAGKISFYNIKGRKIAVCHGRFHLYEGHDARAVSMLVYVLNQLGATDLIVTNAAGSLNSRYDPGDIMIIEDHINLTGQNPVSGQDDHFGQIFTDMSQAYNKTSAAQALRVASELDLPAHIGIYAGVHGPSLETSAERRMLRTLGGDAVGMSTVMEVIAANHCGMQTTGISAITNKATGDIDQQPDTLEDVLHYAEIAGNGIKKIIARLLETQARKTNA